MLGWKGNSVIRMNEYRIIGITNDGKEVIGGTFLGRNKEEAMNKAEQKWAELHIPYDDIIVE